MVQVVTLEKHQYHHCAITSEIIRNYMRKDCNFSFETYSREWNICVDILANIRANCSDSLIMVNESLFNLLSAFLADVRGVSIIFRT